MIGHGCMIGPPAAAGKGIQLIGRMPIIGDTKSEVVLEDFCNTLDGWTISGAGSMAANGTMYASSYGANNGSFHGPNAIKHFDEVAGDFEVVITMNFIADSSQTGQTGHMVISLSGSDGGVCCFSFTDLLVYSGAKHSEDISVVGVSAYSNTASYTTYTNSELKIKRVGSQYCIYKGGTLVVDVLSSIVPMDTIYILFETYANNAADVMNIDSISIKTI